MNKETALAVMEQAELPAVPEQQLDVAVQNFMGINIGGDTVTRCTSHLPDDQKVLVRWLYNLARDKKWGWNDLARETGVDKSVAWRIFQDKYRIPMEQVTEENGVKIRRPHPKAGERISLEGICSKIAKAKKLFEERDSVFSAGFIKTSIWDRLSWACDKALVRNKIVCIYGESQIGKTTCLEEYARLHNGGQTKMVWIPPSAGVQLMTKHIARELRVSTAKPYETLIDDVLNALDKNNLLILDEVHEIFRTYQKTSVMRCMETIRYIHDRTHCGMVLSATNDFRTETEKGEFFQMLKQLMRRTLYMVQLPDYPSREDLKLVLGRYGLPWPKGTTETDFLHMAQEGFGVVLTRLTDGKDLAGKAGEKFGWEHFTEASEIIRKMGLTSKQIEEETEKQKLKN